MKIKNLILKTCVVIIILFIAGTGVAQTEQYFTEKKSTLKTKQSNTPLPIGHKTIRKLLGTDIGQMEFDTKAANNFRAFMTNTLLETSTYNSDSGYDSRHRSSGSGKIQLCSNGTYVEALYSEVIVGAGGTSGTSSGATYIPGYWEVAALPNGKFVILFYSQHPDVLKNFPNGFQPWIVPNYGEDFVSMPNGELYKRTANRYCN